MWDLGSLIRVWTCAPSAVVTPSLNHWITREAPHIFNDHFSPGQAEFLFSLGVTSLWWKLHVFLRNFLADSFPLWTSLHPRPRATLSWRSSRRTWEGEQVCENFPRENDILLLEAVILQANSGCLTHWLVRRRETTEVNGRGQIYYFCSWGHLYLAFIITWKSRVYPSVSGGEVISQVCHSLCRLTHCSFQGAWGGENKRLCLPLLKNTFLLFFLLKISVQEQCSIQPAIMLKAFSWKTIAVPRKKKIYTGSPGYNELPHSACLGLGVVTCKWF